jgi:hypothetical protein
MEGIMLRKPIKYRPGIDDPPPASRWKWLVGALGLAGMVSLVATLAKRIAKPSR